MCRLEDMCIVEVASAKSSGDKKEDAVIPIWGIWPFRGQQTRAADGSQVFDMLKFPPS